MIYFDNAATTLRKPPEVGEAVLRAMETCGNAGRGFHGPMLNASRLLYETREKLAAFFGVGDPSRIAFASSVTDALNIAVSGLVRPGDHVITTACEHNSVLRPLYRKAEEGALLSILPADEQGRLDYEAFDALFSEATRYVFVQHASNLTGNFVDIARMADCAHRHGAILICDAAQTAGAYPIDVKELGIDVLCFTGHKSLLGPQGTGGIYVREGIEIAPFRVGGSGVHSYDRHQPAEMPTVLEAGTQNVPGIAGLGAAIDYLSMVGAGTIHKAETSLADQFLCGIRDIPGVRLYGDFSAADRMPIVSLNIGNLDSGQVSEYLWEDYEICVRSGAHCAPLLHKALGTEKTGAVRFSFSHYNTADEVRCAVRAIAEIASGEC